MDTVRECGNLFSDLQRFSFSRANELKIASCAAYELEPLCDRSSALSCVKYFK
jgi:hypothetical protein